MGKSYAERIKVTGFAYYLGSNNIHALLTRLQNTISYIPRFTMRRDGLAAHALVISKRQSGGSLLDQRIEFQNFARWIEGEWLCFGVVGV